MPTKKSEQYPVIYIQTSEGWQPLHKIFDKTLEKISKTMPSLAKAIERRVVLNEAPPKVRHLAKHAKKARTRNKNINRALREYQRRRRERGA